MQHYPEMSLLSSLLWWMASFRHDELKSHWVCICKPWAVITRWFGRLQRRYQYNWFRSDLSWPVQPSPVAVVQDKFFWMYYDFSFLQNAIRAMQALNCGAFFQHMLSSLHHPYKHQKFNARDTVTPPETKTHTISCSFDQNDPTRSKSRTKIWLRDLIEHQGYAPIRIV